MPRRSSRRDSGDPEMRRERRAGPAERGRGVRRGRARDRWRRQSTLAKVGYTLATLVAVVIVVAGIGIFAVYQRLDSNITKVHVGHLTGRTTYGAQNILVLGSQQRAGQKGYFGVAPGDSPDTSNSDNLLLIHLDPTHTHATVLSIPRDLFVYEPGCQARDSMIGYGIQGPYTYPPGELIDGALNIGGPTCAVQTVEDLTGVRLDHFVEFDFNSFRAMVDTLGGVEVCVPPGPGYHDGYSHLNLRPGTHVLKYNQALAYVRTRHGVGSGADAGGDLPRIELQQAFISSVVQKVSSEGLLSNIPDLLNIADTATKALTVDQGLGSATSLLHLAESLAHLKSRNVTLITLPTAADTFDYPQYDQHLMAVQPQDDVLFQMIRTGQVWYGHLPTEPASTVQVRVLNATGRSGLAATTAAALRKLGFDVVGIGDAPYTATTTVNYAGLTQADGAYTVMTALKTFPAGVNTLAEPAWQVGTAGPVTLTLGADFAGVTARAAPKAKASKPASSPSASGPAASSQPAGPAIQSRNAGASICSGLPPAYTPGALGPP